MHYSLLLGIALTLSKVSADYITPDYPVCKNCDIIYKKDNNAWGLNNKEWCNIDPGKCSSAIADFKAPGFWSQVQGLSRCDHCGVVFKDAFGQYGINEDDKYFCGIDPLTCYQKTENVKTTKEYKFYDKFGLPACDKDHCEVIFKDDYGEYGLMDATTWCGIDMDICSNELTVCDNCNPVYVDNDIVYGIMNNDWCIIDAKKCGIKTSTTTTRKTTTNKKSSTTSSKATATPFWSEKQNLPRCDHCDAIYEDKYGKYGRIEGKDYFCGIDPVSCPNAKVKKSSRTIFWAEKWGYQECADCEVVYEDEFGKYGVNHGEWCGVNQLCKTYPTCNHCDVVLIDEDGAFGVMNNDWCIISTKLCGNVRNTTTTTTKKSTTTTTTTKKSTKKSTTTTKKSTTTKKPSSSPTPKNLFWSEKLGYPRCNHCDIEHSDKYGHWGIMNGEWCGIPQDCSECLSAKYGFPCCEKCEIIFEDDQGLWGVENDNWCGIKFSCSV